MIFPNIKSFPIFWENGMKLSAEHFRHLEDSIEDNVRDNRAVSLLSSTGFGLLPYSKFNVQNAKGQNPQSVRVILNACRAILPGGYRIEILPENIQNLKIPANAPFVDFDPSHNERYHLYLSINESKRIEAGIPQIRPIRKSSLSHEYQLECIPHSRISAVQNIAANRMKIAEWQSGKVLDGYIPPTLSVLGFPLLERWFQFFQNQLENILRVSAHVIHEHRKKDTARAHFCIPIVNYIRSSQGQFRWLIPKQSPIYMAAYFGDLAGLVLGLIETNDRDFVRNFLKNGEINNLRINAHEVIKPAAIPQEEMAIVISKIQRFTLSLIATLKSFVTTKPPTIKGGERNISSG